ncbi:MAG TPA: class I SAM-dependent rRNA methyltransferase [Mobilitalea sp.]|nr:class I SAM-dependent rRNA methyltransferase [Mobilitalea sp.]
MKIQRNFPSVRVTKKAALSLQNGHPWVYTEEITEYNGSFENGDLVDVFSPKGSYLGTGFINTFSKIGVRIISTNANDKFDEAFFKRRLQHAYSYRKTVMQKDINNCRLIFGEADRFPGLTVDRFNNLIVIQVLSLGIEKRIDMLIRLLDEILREDGQAIDGYYFRNDVKIRELEGMQQFKGWYEGLPHIDSCMTTITENGITYNVDIENGQKTGFFLDQKYNRKAVQDIAKGKTVLDCFTHTGSFALNAAKGGAKKVTAVDISQSAIDMAALNAKNNNIENIEFVTADVFDYLKELLEKPRVYDFIILDPPAFTKSRDTIKNAAKGYLEINKTAMRLLPRGGYLATCSCSHFMNEELFKQTLNKAAREAGVSLLQIEARQQSKDHPILWNVPETNYLKFYIFQIV